MQYYNKVKKYMCDIIYFVERNDGEMSEMISLVENTMRKILFSPWHKLLRKIILSSPNKCGPYDLPHFSRMLYHWATGDLWELYGP